MKHLVFSLIAISIFSSCIHSQTDSTAYILPEFKIYQKANEGEDIYNFKNEQNKLILYNDTLFADPSIYRYKVSLSRINKVSFRDGTNVVPGFLYAAAGGFLLGFIVGVTFPMDQYTRSAILPGSVGLGITLGIVLGLATGVGGALVGLITPHYEEYELQKSDITKKRSGIKKNFKYWNVQKK